MNEEYGVFLEELRHMAGESTGKKPFLLAIDGRCASGKTTLADILAKETGALVLHTDDFYLPLSRRSPEDLAQPAGHMDLERFASEVLKPCSAGKSFMLKAYSCSAAKMLPPRKITPQPLVIVEGCYSCHPSLASFYGCKLFMTVSPAAQKKRILKRGGFQKLSAFKSKWIPAEERYFAACAVRENSDYLIDTSAMW